MFASATHVWSDLFFALLIPLLPIMREDPVLDLSYTEVGLLRTGFGAASMVLQVPAGLLAERWNEFWLLLAGNLWVGAGFLVMAALTSFVPLFAATVLGGLGGGTQHPLATSMVSRTYRDEGHSAAVGTVNFAGDIGKLLAPLVVLIGLSWRSTMRLVGGAGMAFMVLSALARRSVASPRESAAHAGGSPSAVGATGPVRGLVALASVGFMDAATRTAALTFVPFVLADRGAGTREVLILLTLLLAGGAAGKYGCGWLDDRYGSIGLVWWTKGVTALLLVVLLFAPVVSAPALVLVLGFGLNGTSSILYAAVAKFAPSERRASTYGYYYTVTEASAIAPVIYGRIADVTNLRATMIVMAAATALILPASLMVRRHLDSGAPSESGSGG